MPVHWPVIIVPSFEDMFESICDKRCHAQWVLHNISSMTEDTRFMLDCVQPCQNKQDHSTVSIDCVHTEQIWQYWQQNWWLPNIWFWSSFRYELHVISSVSNVHTYKWYTGPLSKIGCFGKNLHNSKKTRFVNSNIESHLQSSAIRMSQGFV